MAKKSGQKRAKEAAPEAFVEDLDLELEEEDMVLHNRRRSRRGEGADDHVGSVLPSDAHRLDGYGDDAQMGYHEEEELAVATEKKMRRRTEDDDFDVSGVTLSSVAKEMAKRKKASTEVLDASPVIEAVERDFASLSTSERMAVLKKESPELLKMLENLRQYLAEVKELAKPLHELLFERKVSAEHKNLVSFLETKVQLMLSYCMHVTFYLIMKSEGKKVAGHPVIDNLVELHVYLEKMWPLEEKLQYSLNRLLSGKSLVAARVDDLRPVAETQSGVFSASRPSGNAEARERRQQLRDLHEAEELDREEESAMTRLRTKKASSLNQIDRSSAIAPAKYQEEEDQYFTKIAGNHGEDVEGLSLMDRLRKRQRSNSDALAEKAEQLVGDESEDEDEMSDVDIISDGENFDEEDLDAVWEEEQRREEEEAAKANEPRQKREVQEVDRRKAGTKIESHRGLTKARPKDRKNPRVAQRRKYERGMQVHKSQTRTHQPEPEGGFVGVRAIKPGVVRSRKL